MKQQSARSIAKEQGLQKYFTGIPCVNGHISARYTSKGTCTECAKILGSSQSRKEYEASYYRENKEHVSARSSEYYLQNRERHLKNAKDWTANNKQKRSLISINYKAKRRAWEESGVSFSGLLAWKESQEKVCYWCKRDCATGFHVDHVMPLSKGGKHEIENLAISCQPCNSRKSNKLPEVFAAQVGRVIVTPDMVV